jgi:hypothetical protein
MGFERGVEEFRVIKIMYSQRDLRGYLHVIECSLVVVG